MQTNSRPVLVVAACFAAAFAPSSARAAVVLLQNATATFSQTEFTVGKVIDGTDADDRGWAIAFQFGTAQSAVFETQTDTGSAGGSLLTFTLSSQHTNPGHNLGRFRLSATTDDRSTFADGLATGGDVTANWTLLDPDSAISANGQTLTKQLDLSLLASGANPSVDMLTVTARTSLTGITGFRLEMLTDASLPANGPGRAGNGNFVVSELSVSAVAVPEPAQYVAVTGFALTAFAASRRRR